MKKHTLIIPDLDDFEAEHVAQILSDYKSKILVNKIEAMARKEEGYKEWYDAHLNWHETIMNKIKWVKDE